MDGGVGIEYSELLLYINRVQTDIDRVNGEIMTLTPERRAEVPGIEMSLRDERCLHLKLLHQSHSRLQMLRPMVDAEACVPMLTGKDGVHLDSFRKGMESGKTHFKRKHLKVHRIFKTQGCILCGPGSKEKVVLHTAHLFALQWYDPQRDDFEFVRTLLDDWTDLKRWNTVISLRSPQNLLKMCAVHHKLFDEHYFTMGYDFTRSCLMFISLNSKNPPAFVKPSKKQMQCWLQRGASSTTSGCHVDVFHIGTRWQRAKQGESSVVPSL